MRSKNSFKNKVFSKKNIKKKLTLFFFQTESRLWTKLKKTKRYLNWWPVAPQVAKHVYKVSLFVIYYLIKFDGVIKSSSWLIPKISPANLCKPNHDIIFFLFHFPFWFCKMWRRRRTSQFEYLENEKSCLDEIKNIFHSFWWAVI